jgi:Zn-dependent M28 family amino/carboxypeptidase
MRRLLYPCSIGFIFFTISATAQHFDERALIKNLKILSADSMAGRRVGSTGSSMARHYIQYQFRKLKLEPLGKDYELPFELNLRGEKQTGINLAGIIRAKSKTDQYIVISAHYDHEGIKNDKVFNGADDNASGVGALLAIAEHFRKNKPTHNLIFASFDAEEVGLQGARAFVKQPPVPLNQIILNINMDMVARADKNELVVCGLFYTPTLKPLLEKHGSQDNLKLVFGHDDPGLYRGSKNWTQSSDHGPFHDAKIPFIYFGVDDHQDYHKHTDDFDKVTPAIYISSVKLILKSIIEVDKGLNALAEF